VQRRADNTCDRFKLIGIHVDRRASQLLTMADDHVFPIAEGNLAVAAMSEPISIAVRACTGPGSRRASACGTGRRTDRAVAVPTRARARADVLVVDPQESRLELSSQMGADTLVWSGRDEVVKAAREWSGGEGPPVAVDATGVPDAVRAMVDMAASAGRWCRWECRATKVPPGSAASPRRSSTCWASAAVAAANSASGAAVERNSDMVRRLISHEFPSRRHPRRWRSPWTIHPT